MELTLRPEPKQHLAYEALKDDLIKFVFFGGGAGGGKSWTGCEWLLIQSLRFPDSKWFMGRNELKRLMSSSFQTFRKVCAHHQIPAESWKLNGQYNYIEFYNGSRIDLLDLSFKPSDPLYERLGSTEYTGGWIEEAGEINFKAFDVLKSRIGRHKNKEYELKPKMFVTFNPKKNWLYSKIYKKWKAQSLPEQYAYIQSLYTDNSHTAEEYGDMLSEIEDQVTIQRLKFGNWEYDDDPSKMIDYDALCDMFHNQVDEGLKKYMTIDVARQGKDRAVIMLWYGFKVNKIVVLPKCTIPNLVDRSRMIARDEGVPKNNIIADEDGVGGGFVDDFKCKGFINNASAIQPKTKNPLRKLNYANLKSQCADILAKKINNYEVGVEKTDWEEGIKEELEVLKRADVDKETKFKIISKDDMKELIGRSPDFLDAMIMRMFFEIKQKKEQKKYRTQVKINYVTGKPHR